VKRLGIREAVSRRGKGWAKGFPQREMGLGLPRQWDLRKGSESRWVSALESVSELSRIRLGNTLRQPYRLELSGAGSKAKACSHRPRDPLPPQAVVRIPDKLKHLQSESGRPYRRACNQLGLCIYHTGRPYRRIISQELGQKAMQHCKIAHICTLDSPDFMVWRGIGAPGVIPCESTLDDSLPQNRVYW